MTTESPWAYLIVNADDYGYFNCISRGILESASYGIVTATGIFANSAYFTEHVDWLSDSTDLDLGVHLNITNQTPLTSNMQNRLTSWNGYFPGKYAMMGALLSGRMTIEDVRNEWRAQIERCIDHGLEVHFLNSHEHIHMLPPLFSVVQALASEYDISHIRFARSELFHNKSMNAFVRDMLIKFMGIINRPSLKFPTAHFLGMGESGKLTSKYVEQKLASLKPGRIYELMCHPGHYEKNEIIDPKLLNYHDWNSEFDALTNPVVRDMLDQYRIKLIGYRHLKIQGGKLVVQDVNT